MKIVYNGYSEVGGVYKITNISNERLYVGSTGCFRKRAMNHLNQLTANTHKNTFLQNDFNKCGSDAFRFEVLDVVEGDKANRLNHEQHFLDQFYDGQKNCYNLVDKATDNRSDTHNKETINPLIDGRCKSPSPETLLKRGQAIRKSKSTPEQKEKARQNCLNGRWKNHSANVTVTNLVTKEIATITGSVREWCLLRNLSYKAFNQLLNGKIKSSGGWVTFPESGIYLSLE